ncbi:MAG: ankyrin repeat domain-containing protein, partial [Thermoguttaceae bacterium]|nr:ankyrin repeat domain-containing protein [Thermoguttaceae bacterium]
MTPSRRLSFLRAVGWGLCCVSVALLTFTIAFAQGPAAPPRRGPEPHRPPAPPRPPHPQPPRPDFPRRPEETIHVKKTLPLPPVREGDRPYKKPPHLDQRVGNLRFVLDRFERDGKVTCDLTVSGGKPGWIRDWTPLHEAAALGDIPGIHKALEGRFNVNASRQFLTPLHVAVILNQTDAIRLLLKKGADLRAQTFTHQGPADLARACRHPETARLLSAFTAAQRYLDKHPKVVV